MEHIIPSQSLPSARSAKKTHQSSMSKGHAPRKSLPDRLFIVTDYDRQYNFGHPTASSPDADPIFHMSPIHTNCPASAPSQPLLYSFPRPSRAQGLPKPPAHNSSHVVYKPKVPISSFRDFDVGTPRQPAPFSDAPTPKAAPKTLAPPSNSRHHHTSRPSPSSMPRVESPHLYSSGRTLDRSPSRFSGGTSQSPSYGRHSPHSGTSRVEEDEAADDSGSESSSPSPSTACSSASVDPFRFSKFLDDMPH